MLVTNVSKRTIVLHDGVSLDSGASKEYAAPLPYHQAVAGLIGMGDLQVEGGDLLLPPGGVASVPQVTPISTTAVMPPVPQVTPISTTAVMPPVPADPVDPINTLPGLPPV